MKNQIKSNPQEGKSGFPDPIKAKCFKCQKIFWIKFVVPQRDYSKKNNWEYWTQKETDKGFQICNLCLRNFYLKDKKNYLATVKDTKKKRMLSAYINDNYI